MLRQLAASVLLASLTACDPAPPDSSERLVVYLLGPATDEHRVVVEDAAAILGLQPVILPRDASASDASIVLSIHDHPDDHVDHAVCPGFLGYAAKSQICGRVAWCYDDARICAHEIGHQLGLWDDPDSVPPNVMHPADRDALEVTDEQFDLITDRLGEIRDTCG